jgi:PAS domain S-box-containing protein
MGTWDWNVLTGAVTWSPNLEAIHGLPPGSFRGTFAAVVEEIHPDDRAAVVHSITRSLEEGSEHHVEYRILWSDGSIHWVEGRGRLFHDTNGQPDRMIGVCVDANDHVLILNRQDVNEGDLNAARLAPPLIEFDAAGNVVHSWGDLNVIDSRLHSCHFDPEGNVWIGSSPSGMVQKYTHDGSKLLLQLGKKGVFDSSDGTAKGKPLNSNAAAFYMPSSIFVDRTNGDVYVSDGEGAGGNRRIAVMDKTGKFLRQWQPTDMDMVHCMTMAKDGLVYVCNRTGSKIQVYDKMGSLKRMIDVPWTPVTPPKDGKLTQSGGSAVAIDFSPDQRLMFVINQNNSEVDIIDRQSGQKVTSFGRPGSFAGQFNQPHGIAVDSKGNVYIAENRGKRIHKFRPVT